MTDQAVPASTVAGECWTRLERHLNRWFYRPDLEALHCVLTACRAHYGDGHPIWLFVIGPPGSGKTSIAVTSAATLPLTHVEGDLTMKAMMSGKKGGEQTSILDKYGKSFILLFKDFTTILSKRDDDQRELVGMFREMYDGEYHRKTAERWGDWHGKATVIAAVTPAIERAWSVYRALGERFMQVRWPNSNPQRVAKAARRQYGIDIQTEIQSYTREIFEESCRVTTPPDLTESQGDRIDTLATVIALLRNHVIRDTHGDRDIIDLCAPEEPSRIAQSLSTIARFHALLMCRNEVNEHDVRIARRVAFDSIPHHRSKLVHAVSPDVAIPVHAIRESTGQVRATITWTADELVALGVLTQQGTALDEISYKLTPNFAELWQGL